MADKKPLRISDDANDLNAIEFQAADSLGIVDGGTSATTANDAINNLLPAQAGNVGKYLQTDGANTSWQEAAGAGEEGGYASAKADHVSSPIHYDLDIDTWTKFTDFNLKAESTVATVDLVGQKIDINTDGDGVYAVNFTFNAQFNTAGLFSVAVYKNGSIVATTETNGDFSNGQDDFVAGSCMFSLVDGDYLELYMKSTNVNQDPDIESVTLNIHRVSGGSVGPTGPTGPTGATGPQGPAGLFANWLGAYSGATAYAVDDAVEYLGSSYVCVTATSPGEDPVGTPAKWDLAAQKGDTGAAGSGGEFYSYFRNGTPSLAVTSPTYSAVSRHIFRGTNSFTPTSLKIIALSSTVNGWARIYDLTNALVIAEVAVTSNVNSIIDMGTISNLSAGESIWEVQLKNTDNNQDIHISSLKVE